MTATDRGDAVFKGASRAPRCRGARRRYFHRRAGWRLTSMAAAQVSGAVALLLDAKPGLDPKAVRDLLIKTAKHLSPADPDESSIAGIVDAYAMLEAAEAPRESDAPEEGRSTATRGSDSRPTDAKPPQADQNPTGPVKPDAQPDAPSLPTATEAELARKEEVLWQLMKDGLLSFDQFQRQLLDLEAAKTEFINKCPAAPHLPRIVKAEFQESDRARATALIRDYGLDAQLTDTVTMTKITVPARQEWFWVDILKASGLFTQVGREDYYCTKSMDTEFGIAHPDIALPAPTTTFLRRMILKTWSLY